MIIRSRMIINSNGIFYYKDLRNIENALQTLTNAYERLIVPTSMDTLNLSEDDGMYIMKNTFENAEMLIILDFVIV